MRAWFLGPRAENVDLIMSNLTELVRSIHTGRNSYFPDDAVGCGSSPQIIVCDTARHDIYSSIFCVLCQVSITQDMKKSDEFDESKERLAHVLGATAKSLADHSVPFFSPRYAAHMCSDISREFFVVIVVTCLMASLVVPATLGYFLAQQYNQNNVALEASPMTSWIEWYTGQQLCDVLGFETDINPFGPNDNRKPSGWGHITADGSIANLESMWCVSLSFFILHLSGFDFSPCPDFDSWLVRIGKLSKLVLPP